jgi:hypothetical protein
MNPRAPQNLNLRDAEVLFSPAFFSAPEADRLLNELRETTEWRQDTMGYGNDSRQSGPFVLLEHGRIVG